MPSRALQEWSAGRAAALDEIESAHRAVGGSGRGRRYATQQINHAYAVLLAGQFQAFCRDLHTECVRRLAAAITPAAYQGVVREEFLWNRRLDRGNATSENLAADFGRLGLELWVRATAADARNAQRRQLLNELNEWRNAIAHQDFVGLRVRVRRPVIQLAQVQDWRRACDALARSFDGVLGAYVQGVTGVAPW